MTRRKSNSYHHLLVRSEALGLMLKLYPIYFGYNLLPLQKVNVNVILADRKARRLIFSGRPKEKEEIVEKKRNLMVEYFKLMPMEFPGHIC